MNKEERVKLVFETISKIAGFEITPDKDFYMVKPGLKCTYKIGEDLTLYYKTPNGEYKESFYNISTFFNTVSQLEEIQEPLLTEEEKEFLRGFKFEWLSLKPSSLYLYSVTNVTVPSSMTLVAHINLNNINISFDGLEKEWYEDRKYSREDLGL